MINILDMNSWKNNNVYIVILSVAFSDSLLKSGIVGIGKGEYPSFGITF